MSLNYLKSVFQPVFIGRLVVGAIVAGSTAFGISFVVSDYVVKANSSSNNEAFAALRLAIETNTQRSNQNSEAMLAAFSNLSNTINNNTTSSNNATDRLVRSLESTDDSLNSAISENTSAIRGLTDAADAQRRRVDALGQQVSSMQDSIEQTAMGAPFFPNEDAPFFWASDSFGRSSISTIDPLAMQKVRNAWADALDSDLKTYDFKDVFVRQTNGDFLNFEEAIGLAKE